MERTAIGHSNKVRRNPKLFGGDFSSSGWTDDTPTDLDSFDNVEVFDEFYGRHFTQCVLSEPPDVAEFQEEGFTRYSITGHYDNRIKRYNKVHPISGYTSYRYTGATNATATELITPNTNPIIFDDDGNPPAPPANKALSVLLAFRLRDYKRIDRLRIIPGTTPTIVGNIYTPIPAGMGNDNVLQLPTNHNTTTDLTTEPDPWYVYQRTFAQVVALKKLSFSIQVVPLDTDWEFSLDAVMSIDLDGITFIGGF